MTKTDNEVYKTIQQMTQDDDRLLALICFDSTRHMMNPNLSRESKLSQIELLITRCQEWMAKQDGTKLAP